jgi:hypothetical protein
MRKYKTYLEPVWVESARVLHPTTVKFWITTINNEEKEYLWRGPDDVLEFNETTKYLAKRPSDDMTKAEKLDVPVEDLIGWTILDTRIESQLLEWEKLKKEQGEEC